MKCISDLPAAPPMLNPAVIYANINDSRRDRRWAYHEGTTERKIKTTFPGVWGRGPRVFTLYIVSQKVALSPKTFCDIVTSGKPV